MKTKHTISLFLLMLIFIQQAFGQNFKLGIQAGFDISKTQVIYKANINNESRLYYPMISFNVNGFLGYKGTSLIGISMEPGYIQKGGVEHFNNGQNTNIRFQLDYVQIPISMEIYLTKKFTLLIGPEIAYMIKATAKSKNGSNSILNRYDNRTEVSGLIGLNYHLLGNFNIGIRYNHGLTNTSETQVTDGNGNILGKAKEYNQYIQFMVRYTI